MTRATIGFAILALVLGGCSKAPYLEPTPIHPGALEIQVLTGTKPGQIRVRFTNRGAGTVLVFPPYFEETINLQADPEVKGYEEAIHWNVGSFDFKLISLAPGSFFEKQLTPGNSPLVDPKLNSGAHTFRIVYRQKEANERAKSFYGFMSPKDQKRLFPAGLARSTCGDAVSNAFEMLFDSGKVTVHTEP